MIVGIPKEIKNNENRVGMTPAGVNELVKRGHTVYVQKNAGANSGFDDSQYERVGAKIVDTIEEVYAIAEMIVKVKEPIEPEYPLIRKGQLLARLDTTDYAVQLKATEAEYQQVKGEAERVIALYSEGGTTPVAYDKARYGLQQIEAKYKNHKDMLAYAYLYAPFDGYVQKTLFDEHETVAAGMPVISIISQDTPEVELNLPASEYIRRNTFEKFSCTLDIYPGKVYPLQLIGF